MSLVHEAILVYGAVGVTTVGFLVMRRVFRREKREVERRRLEGLPVVEGGSGDGYNGM